MTFKEFLRDRIQEKPKSKYNWEDRTLDREEVLRAASDYKAKLIHNELGLYDDPDLRNTDGYMIFKADGTHWKVRFEEDSMGDGYFTGDITKVTPVTKTITVWE